MLAVVSPAKKLQFSAEMPPFAPTQPQFKSEIKDLVERAILFFETRITLDGIEVLAEEVNDGLIQIQLEYTIRTTNTRSNFVYPFYFQEGTNVGA